jgi:hypothetical protein
MGATDDRQEALPLAGRDGSEPVPFRLTARARREVAPETLPELAVVPGREATDRAGGAADPHDPRPARARALRRSGRSAEEIAHRLAVDEEIVDRWCDGVRPTRRVRERTTPTVPVGDLRRRVEARDAVHDVVTDGYEVAALAALAALAVVHDGGISVTVPDPSLAPLLLAGLRRIPGAEEHLRLRIGVPVGTARDLAEQRWAARLGLAAQSVHAVPWSDAPDGDSVRLTFRLGGRDAASVVLGWRDALAATNG